MSEMRAGVGVIGLGVQGAAVRDELDRAPGLRVVASFDPRPDAPHLPGARRATLEAVCSDPAVSIVYIAAPPGAHEAAVACAARAGRAIVCEKPLAPDPAAAARMTAAVRAAGVAAGTNFYLATAPGGRRLVAGVEAGTLGTIERVELTARFARWPRAWQADAGAWLRSPGEGGFTREVVSHFVWLADRLLGPGELREAAVEPGQDGLERRVTATLSHGGVPFTIAAAIEGPDEDRTRFVVYGSRGLATIADWDDVSGVALPTVATEGLAAAVAALGAGRPHPLPDFATATRVTETIEAILAEGRARAPRTPIDPSPVPG